jgi:hypothetical protein
MTNLRLKTDWGEWFLTPSSQVPRPSLMLAKYRTDASPCIEYQDKDILDEPIHAQIISWGDF